MKPGFLAAIGLIMSQGFAADMGTIHVPSYTGYYSPPFHFRTPNQRKRRRANRQQGSKSRSLKP